MIRDLLAAGVSSGPLLTNPIFATLIPILFGESTLIREWECEGGAISRSGPIRPWPWLTRVPVAECTPGLREYHPHLHVLTHPLYLSVCGPMRYNYPWYKTGWVTAFWGRWIGGGSNRWLCIGRLWRVVLLPQEGNCEVEDKSIKVGRHALGWPL